MKRYISYQKARSMVSALGWAKVKSGFMWPTGVTGPWLGWSGSRITSWLATVQGLIGVKNDTSKSND